MLDGIGREIKVGDIVVRCAYGGYAMVRLYKVKKLANINVLIDELRKDIDNKTLELVNKTKSYVKSASVNPSALVVVNELIKDFVEV